MPIHFKNISAGLFISVTENIENIYASRAYYYYYYYYSTITFIISVVYIPSTTVHVPVLVNVALYTSPGPKNPLLTKEHHCVPNIMARCCLPSRSFFHPTVSPTLILTSGTSKPPSMRETYTDCGPTSITAVSSVILSSTTSLAGSGIG